jgi:iron complex outermembrane receptor protein
MVAASLFQIRKGLEFVNADNYFVRAGQAQHRGLELSAQGKVSNDLRLSASATLLNSQQSGTGNTDLDGKRVANVPAFKTTVHADYTVRQVAGLSVNGSWEYAGKKAFDSGNTVFVPSYNVFNAGAAYATRIAGTPAIVRATVNNLFDKFYWRDVTPQAGGYLFPGASRTLRVSAQFDFSEVFSSAARRTLSAAWPTPYAAPGCLAATDTESGAQPVRRANPGKSTGARLPTRAASRPPPTAYRAP